MRDLQGIAEINGPRRVDLQAERAENIKKNSTPQWGGLFQTLHGERVEERARVNGFPGPGTVRAVPRVRNRVTNAPAYHGEYCIGTVWHKVLNNAQLPICYTTPEYALAAALLHFDAAR